MPLPVQPPRSPLTPYPRGWFLVAFSNEIAKGAVVPARYFGRDLAVFRTEDGKVHVTSAHCPHLGAHIGHGGRVEGGCVRCPFHGWKYDAESGQCAEIPYARKIPIGAKLHVWPVREVSGMVLLWHHELGEAPTWEVPEIGAETEGEWTPWKETRWKIRSRIQDVTENDLDGPHIPALHHFAVGMPETRVTADGPRLDVLMNIETTLAHFGMEGTVRAPVSTTKHGISIGYIRQSVDMGAYQLSVRTLGNTTPIDEEHVDIRLIHSIRKSGMEHVDEMVEQSYFHTFKEAVEQDVVIWENKVFLTRPLLCEGDGPIGVFRKWTRQFYSEDEIARAMGQPPASLR